MLNTCFHRLALVAILLSVVSLTGCGGKGSISVEGKVVLPPNLKLGQDNLVVRFVPEGEEGKAFSGSISADNPSFTEKKVTPGKYKVQVEIQLYGGEETDPKRTKAVEAFNQIYNEKNSKLSAEVASEPKEQTFTIDLVKSTVTKN